MQVASSVRVRLKPRALDDGSKLDSKKGGWVYSQRDFGPAFEAMCLYLSTTICTAHSILVLVLEPNLELRGLTY